MEKEPKVSHLLFRRTGNWEQRRWSCLMSPAKALMPIWPVGFVEVEFTQIAQDSPIAGQAKPSQESSESDNGPLDHQ